MTSSKLSGLLFGATALVLVTASSAIAQQTTGQDTARQQTTQQGTQQQQGAQQAQTGQQQGGQQAGQQQAAQQQAAPGAGQQDQEAQPAMYQLRQQLQQIREAIEQQDLAKAEQALQQAEQTLDQAQMASQQTGQQQGDIRVTVVPSDQEEQAQATGTAAPESTAEATRLTEEETYRLLGMGDREIGEATEVLTLTPLDLEERDVITMDGQEVGEVNEVVSSGDQFYAIVEHGGFLGIGEDRVAIPLERIGMRGEEIILLGLTEEQLEQMPEYDYEADQAVTDEQSIEVGRYE